LPFVLHGLQMLLSFAAEERKKRGKERALTHFQCKWYSVPHDTL